MYVCFVSGGGVDYVSGPYDVIFRSGATYASFDVVISDDNAYRGNVNFNLTINSSILPNDVMVGDIGQAVVIIVEDDCKFVLHCTQCVANRK